MSKTFEEKTGINVKMQRKSSGETFAQIRAESANPKGDVWWGGTGDPHCRQPKKLTAPYVSPMRESYRTGLSAKLTAQAIGRLVFTWRAWIWL